MVAPTHSWSIECDFLTRWGGYAAYGKAVVFDVDHPLGLCLAW